MTHMVLTFRGLAGDRSAALERLRVVLPSAVLTPKTSTLVEAQMNEEEIPLVVKTGEWDVAPSTFAEIRPPTLDMGALRKKLGR